MPCRSDEYESDVRINQQRELDKVTRMLCEVLSQIETKSLSSEIRDWWKEHQEKDKERLRQEKARKAAQRHAELEGLEKYLYNRKSQIPGFVAVGIGEFCFLYIDKKSNLRLAVAWLHANVAIEKLSDIQVSVSGQPVTLTRK